MWLSYLLATTIAAHAPSDLVAAAAASSQPAICRAGKRQRTLWQRARRPSVRRYCRLLSRAQVRLKSDPDQAKKDATAADQLVKGTAAPQVLLARLALAEGDAKAALAAFELAQKRDPRSIDPPAAMHALARAQRKAGKHVDALATYRVLVPRIALLPGRAQRAQVLLEATYAALESAPAERRAAEALAYLREASRDSYHALRTDVAITLALVLDLAGRHAQADAVIADQRGVASWSKRTTGAYLVHAEDLPLLRAMAQSAEDPAAASKAFAIYLTGSRKTGPFAEVAQRRSQPTAPRRRGR